MTETRLGVHKDIRKKPIISLSISNSFGEESLFLRGRTSTQEQKTFFLEIIILFLLLGQNATYVAKSPIRPYGRFKALFGLSSQFM
jgi:hypothetical protein